MYNHISTSFKIIQLRMFHLLVLKRHLIGLLCNLCLEHNIFFQIRVINHQLDFRIYSTKRYFSDLFENWTRLLKNNPNLTN